MLSAREEPPPDAIDEAGIEANRGKLPIEPQIADGNWQTNADDADRLEKSEWEEDAASSHRAGKAKRPRSTTSARDQVVPC
jgi:hypothetical protein